MTSATPWRHFEALVVSPTPSHPQDHGNRKRIFEICRALQHDTSITGECSEDAAFLSAQISYAFLNKIPKLREILLTDVDALTISMAKSVAAGVTPETAAAAIAVGILANSAMKAALAAALGTREFALRTGGALAMMAAALTAVLLVLR